MVPVWSKGVWESSAGNRINWPSMVYSMREFVTCCLRTMATSGSLKYSSSSSWAGTQSGIEPWTWLPHSSLTTFRLIASWSISLCNFRTCDDAPAPIPVVVWGRLSDFFYLVCHHCPARLVKSFCSRDTEFHSLTQWNWNFSCAGSFSFCLEHALFHNAVHYNLTWRTELEIRSMLSKSKTIGEAISCSQ